LAGSLRKAVDKDIEHIRGKAIAYADERKAALVTDSANAAKALFEATKDKATAAGAAKAKLASQLKYYQGQAMSAGTDEEKATADAKVVELEGQIAELEEERAAAQKEAARLEEANKNSQALSALADEIAAAKNDTDAVVAGLVETQEKIQDAIFAREETEEELHGNADRLRYEAETEGDEQKAEQRWTFFEVADLAIQQMHQRNEDDRRLVDEYEFNIRQVRNGYRVTKAKLIAERTNAELMVAIKNEMNMGEDLTDIGAAKTKLETKLAAEADATKQQALTAAITGLAERLTSITTVKGTMSAII